jgi:anion-transporting  ArsA/GET3 family ATPase
MTRIITFLSKGVGQTDLAIATAHRFTEQGHQVLLVTHSPSARAELCLQTSLTSIPQIVAPRLQAVELQTTSMLEQVWNELKKLFSLYVPADLSEEVYAGELIIPPGLDSLLAFNALREYYQSGDYDVIVYDGRGDLETLRMLGIPEILDWYFRRFRQLFDFLNLSKMADSIGGPLASALLTANLDQQKLQAGLKQAREWIDQGLAVIEDPSCLSIYLVTSDEPAAVAESRWLWGSAQQVNLRVNGVLAYSQQTLNLDELHQAFAPLTVTPIPLLLSSLQSPNWELIKALPDFNHVSPSPQPLTINLEQQQIVVFLPGFTKKQVKLTQHGSALTVEAGDQRRNIFLPPAFQQLSLKSGKFEEPNLVIAFE